MVLRAVSKKKSFRFSRATSLLAAEPLPRVIPIGIAFLMRRRRRSETVEKEKEGDLSLSHALSPHHQKKTTTAAPLLLFLMLLTLSGLIGDLDEHLLGLVLLKWELECKKERE